MDNAPPVQQVMLIIVWVKQLQYSSFLCFMDFFMFGGGVVRLEGCGCGRVSLMSLLMLTLFLRFLQAGVCHHYVIGTWPMRILQ